MLLVKSSQTRWQATDLTEMFNTGQNWGGGGGGNVAQGCCNNQKIFQTDCLEISMSSLWIGKQTSTPASRGKDRINIYNNAIGRQFHPEQYIYILSMLAVPGIKIHDLGMASTMFELQEAWAECRAYNIQCYITEKSLSEVFCKEKYYFEADFLCLSFTYDLPLGAVAQKIILVVNQLIPLCIMNELWIHPTQNKRPAICLKEKQL